MADTVYQRADACRHWLFLFSVIKNTMENRKCQLQTWKVEKYSGNLCAARTGRGVLERSRRRRPEMPVFTGGKCRAHGGGKRGIRHRMVSYPPLNSPSSSFKPRLPAVARLNARGPQGRLVLQGHTLDGSGAFRSGTPPPCTVWPRTVMRGKSRKVNSGHKSVT